MGKSQIFNKNNNTYNLKKPNNKNNIIEIANSNNNSFYKNIIINNNSSKNINPNSNLLNQKKSNNNYYLKTEKYNIGAKTPKESNIKLIFNNKNINGKKLEDTPIILKKKDSSLPLKNNNGNNLKVSIDKNASNGEYKLHLKKPTKNISNDNNIINMNLNNYINIQKDEKIILENNYKEKKKKINGPEDLHFYYIKVIQEGKETEIGFEKD